MMFTSMEPAFLIYNITIIMNMNAALQNDVRIECRESARARAVCEKRVRKAGKYTQEIHNDNSTPSLFRKTEKF